MVGLDRHPGAEALTYRRTLLSTPSWDRRPRLEPGRWLVSACLRRRPLLTAGPHKEWAAWLVGWSIATEQRPVRAGRDAHRWPCCDRPSLGWCPGPTGPWAHRAVVVGGSHHATSPDRRHRRLRR